MVEVVAALVHDTENPRRFLICQRPAHKARGLLWEFVGGKVEPGKRRGKPSRANAGRSLASQSRSVMSIWS